MICHQVACSSSTDGQFSQARRVSVRVGVSVAMHKQEGGVRDGVYVGMMYKQEGCVRVGVSVVMLYKQEGCVRVGVFVALLYKQGGCVRVGVFVA